MGGCAGHAGCRGRIRVWQASGLACEGRRACRRAQHGGPTPATCHTTGRLQASRPRVAPVEPCPHSESWPSQQHATGSNSSALGSAWPWWWPAIAPHDESRTLTHVPRDGLAKAPCDPGAQAARPSAIAARRPAIAALLAPLAAAFIVAAAVAAATSGSGPVPGHQGDDHQVPVARTESLPHLHTDPQREEPASQFSFVTPQLHPYTVEEGGQEGGRRWMAK